MVIKLLNIIPPSINHYWLGGGRRRYVSKRGVQFKKALALCAKGKVRLITDQVALSILWATKDKRRRDVDNILKPILDALNGVAYVDDSQVVELFVKKIQSTQDSLEIHIKELP